jgi:hypothetical protein
MCYEKNEGVLIRVTRTDQGLIHEDDQDYDDDVVMVIVVKWWWWW